MLRAQGGTKSSKERERKGGGEEQPKQAPTLGGHSRRLREDLEKKGQKVPKALSVTTSSRGDIRRGQPQEGVHLEEIRGGGVMVIDRVAMASGGAGGA